MSFPFRVDPSFRQTFPGADLKGRERVINRLLTDVILMGPHSRKIRAHLFAPITVDQA